MRIKERYLGREKERERERERVEEHIHGQLAPQQNEPPFILGYCLGTA